MKGMKKYYTQKIMWYLLTLVFAVLLNFILPRLMPGDPVSTIASKSVEGMTDATAIQKVYEDYAAKFGINKPMYVQFFTWVKNALRGDFGISFSQYPRTVSDIISSSVLWTICLQLPAIIVGWILGNLLGAIAAYMKGVFDKAILPAFLFISNVPAFGMATVLLFVFSLKLHIAPAAGGYASSMIPHMSLAFMKSVLSHYQLPFWSIVIITIGGQAIGMRSMSIYELNADYVKYSRFLGIKDHTIVKYVFRNAMLPQITGLAMSLGTMIGGNLVAEMVFSYPGLGTTMLSAVTGQDYPLLSACTLIITIMVLLANLLVELLYAVIDPRVKASSRIRKENSCYEKSQQTDFSFRKIVTGFVIFLAILLTIIIYPLVVAKDPLAMIGNGNFFKPGTYLSIQDTVNSGKTYKMNVDATASIVESKLTMDNRSMMAEWLEKYGGVDASEIDVTDAEGLIALWEEKYDPNAEQKGLIAAKKKKYQRLDKEIDGILEDVPTIIAEKNEETGELEEVQSIDSKQYINEKDVINRQTFVLGTDNFGRDVLTELISATGSSLKIGLVAGIIATVIGLFLGLLAGYLGGFVDNLILFFTNLFTVIPSFVLLILISYSVGESQRGIMMVALLIGITAWPWTTRSVRSQVISLRNRDHVNLSKLSGHSMLRIVLTDILPYVASYVVMAFILQISSGILAEAQLSMIGLGPATTKTATLGLMMQWATQYNAHLNGAWWAYFPVILVIALISFSLNLMNTGLDQVFNPQLRD